ncbi:SCO family protein [Aliiroseovarius sp. YM-037]|uniref:SCO family protein n=1 Tax=Aliiroseovarius sp. YM-037 TaxID=3341728 RepID=UPI003A80DFAA
MVRTYAIVAGAAIVALIAGVYVATTRGGEEAFAQCRSGQVAGGMGSVGGPFTLVDQTGQTVTDEDVFTKPSIVYFGYTFCPDVCPADTARNAIAVDILEENGTDVTPVMISIDPERDTPEVMADYAFNLHDKMIGLTGSLEQVRAASQAYKTYFNKQDAEDEFYLVDHSTFSYLVLPEKGVVEFYRRETTPEEMAESVACFVDAAS